MKVQIIAILESDRIPFRAYKSKTRNNQFVSSAMIVHCNLEPSSHLFTDKIIQYT